MGEKLERNYESIDALDNERIPIARAGCTFFISRALIQWVEADGDYMRLHTATQVYLLRVPLIALEKRWSKYGFARINRSHLVSLPFVTDLFRRASGYAVRLGSDSKTIELSVSRRELQKFRQRWQECQRNINSPRRKPSLT